MTDDYLWLDGVSEENIRRERAKARELRKTRWWQQKTAAGTCYYCGTKVTHRELTMDHLVPLARGGRRAKRSVRRVFVKHIGTTSSLRSSIEFE